VTLSVDGTLPIVELKPLKSTEPFSQEEDKEHDMGCLHSSFPYVMRPASECVSVGVG